IIIEPIPANNGLLIQDPSYLEFLRDITSNNNALLIFDEVISGFRVGFEGAAKYYNIRPDIITYGKIIGGGLPVGAYGSSSDIMKKISPEGDVYQAGTLSGNPVAMAAGIAQLHACLTPGFYEGLEEKTKMLQRSIMDHVNRKGYKFKLYTFGSIFWISFSDKENIQSAGDIDLCGMETFNLFYNYLLEHGIYLGPSGYEVGFVSAAHSNEDIERTAQIMTSALDEVLS
ncbi:MAG: aspartate aminotransferase family protein, partial [Bacteroidetes bacterium]